MGTFHGRTGKSFMGKMLGVINRGGADRLGPSRFNFGGIGRWMFKKMMKNANAIPLPDLIRHAQELGVELVACEMSMQVMEIEKEDLIDGVRLGGVGTFIGAASESRFSLFI